MTSSQKYLLFTLSPDSFNVHWFLPTWKHRQNLWDVLIRVLLIYNLLFRTYIRINKINVGAAQMSSFNLWTEFFVHSSCQETFKVAFDFAAGVLIYSLRLSTAPSHVCIRCAVVWDKYQFLFQFLAGFCNICNQVAQSLNIQFCWFLDFLILYHNVLISDTFKGPGFIQKSFKQFSVLCVIHKFLTYARSS